MFRLLLFAPALVLCANVHAQLFDWFCPQSLNVLVDWSDSLQERHKAPARYLDYKGNPTLISIQAFKVDRDQVNPFNPQSPFEEMTKEVGQRTVFRFDGVGRLTSCRRTERRSDGTEILSDLDSMEYGPVGLARMVRGSDFMDESKYQWEGGRIVSKETLSNGFVIGKTTWSYDDSRMTIDVEQSSAFDPYARRSRWTALAKDTVASIKTMYGRDTSLTEYRYFKDSLSTLYWSNDTNEFKGREPKWKQAWSTRILPSGERMETEYYSDESRTPNTVVYTNGKLTMISRYCDEETIVYNDRGDPVRMSNVLGCEEVPEINQTLRSQFYYRYDAIGNPTEILFMNGLDRFNSWPNDWPSEITLWRFEYEYP